jgi:hypothetical protein
MDGKVNKMDVVKNMLGKSHNYASIYEKRRYKKLAQPISNISMPSPNPGLTPIQILSIKPGPIPSLPRPGPTPRPIFPIKPEPTPLPIRILPIKPSILPPPRPGPTPRPIFPIKPNIDFRNYKI